VCIEDSCSKCGRFILTEAFGCFDIVSVVLLGVAFVWSTIELIFSDFFPPHCINGYPRFFFIQAPRHGPGTCPSLYHRSDFEDLRQRKSRTPLGSPVRPFVAPFFFLSSPILFVRTGYHKSQSESLFRYTVRGFGKDGFAVKTIHVYSVTRSKVFRNGGTVWKLGGRRLDFQKECENLK